MKATANQEKKNQNVFEQNIDRYLRTPTKTSPKYGMMLIFRDSEKKKRDVNVCTKHCTFKQPDTKKGLGTSFDGSFRGGAGWSVRGLPLSTKP
ncbi:hypothetical protein CEXT_151801 [Caerostris extrusa]|uniref:Uncharacterized protein n=1 Tax=Caerostris extrusa TaxID=172846 RepID=A0AAV4UUC0_CAEEX|nr:hypothetical protein CEXT_151801 [Caerostris extrusa]